MGGMQESAAPAGGYFFPRDSVLSRLVAPIMVQIPRDENIDRPGEYFSFQKSEITLVVHVSIILFVNVSINPMGLSVAQDYPIIRFHSTGSSLEIRDLRPVNVGS